MTGVMEEESDAPLPQGDASKMVKTEELSFTWDASKSFRANLSVIISFPQVTEEDQDRAGELLTEARQAFADGDTSRAVDLLTEALQLDPNNAR